MAATPRVRKPYGAWVGLAGCVAAAWLSACQRTPAPPTPTAAPAAVDASSVDPAAAATIVTAPAQVASPDSASETAATLPAMPAAEPTPTSATASEQVRSLLARCPLGIGDAEYAACTASATALVQALDQNKIQVNPLYAAVVLPAVAEAVALAETVSPGEAALVPVAELFADALAKCSTSNEYWRLRGNVATMRAIVRGELGQKWSPRGRHAALEWLFESSDRILMGSSDQYDPAPVCTAPPWLADRWGFCAGRWLEILAAANGRQVDAVRQALSQLISNLQADRDWAKRYWAVAASLDGDNPQREVVLDLLLAPDVRPEVVAAFDQLLEPIDPAAVLLPKNGDRLADDVLAAARTRVAARPRPALRLANEPRTVAAPGVPDEVAAALPAFHAAMTAYIEACEPSDGKVSSSGRCAKAHRAVKKLGLATPGLMGHWLGQRWWPRWREGGSDLKLFEADLKTLGLPIEPVWLAYCAHNLAGALALSTKADTSDRDVWPTVEAMHALDEATALHLDGFASTDDASEVELAQLWFRYLDGQPLPADATTTAEIAWQLAEANLTSGSYWREKRAHQALDSGKWPVKAELRALQREVRRNRWLTPTDRGYDREELPIAKAREILQTPLQGPAFPRVDRAAVPPAPSREY